MALSDLPLLSRERLGPSHLAEVLALLDRDPVLYVYLQALVLRDALARPGDEFWGARREGSLLGLVHLGGASGAVLPSASDETTERTLADCIAERIVSVPPRFQVIGPRSSVEAIVQRLGPLEPRLHQPQLYLALARGQLAGARVVPELRPARATDYRIVFESGAALRAEELGEDPRSVDAAAYARRVEEECRDGHTWVWIDEHGLRFRASISALTPEAAQVSGVYVPPERRNQGFAGRGLRELCARLLERSRTACLFVNDHNAPALAVYRRLGFGVRAEWASAFYDRRVAANAGG